MKYMLRRTLNFFKISQVHTKENPIIENVSVIILTLTKTRIFDQLYHGLGIFDQLHHKYDIKDMILVPFQFLTAIFVQLHHGIICKMIGALNSRVNVVVDNGIGLWIAIEYDILSMKTHYVNVSVLIKFSQKTSVFTLIVISSP